MIPPLWVLGLTQWGFNAKGLNVKIQSISSTLTFFTVSALCINAGGHRKAIREPQRRLQRRAYLPIASQTVQSGPCRRLAFCERITSHTSCASSSGRPTSYCNTMDTGDCPCRKKRRPWRMDFSSFALVTVMLIVCQTALVRAGKELYLARSYKNLLPILV